MWFIIRSVFWISLVLLLIPLGGGTGQQNQEAVSPIEAFAAAREAIGDLSGMCERKPDVCETGRAALHTIGVRARDSARIAYQVLDDRFGPPPAETAGLAPEQQKLADTAALDAARAAAVQGLDIEDILRDAMQTGSVPSGAAAASD